MNLLLLALIHSFLVIPATAAPRAAECVSALWNLEHLQTACSLEPTTNICPNSQCDKCLCDTINAFTENNCTYSHDSSLSEVFDAISSLCIDLAPEPVNKFVTRQFLPIPHNLLWPRPQFFEHGTSDTLIDPATVDISFFAGENQQLLEHAGERFRINALAIGCNDAQTAGYGITKIKVFVTGTDPVNFVYGDESYTLQTDASSVTINANNSVGAIRALETLTQLVKPISVLPSHIRTDVNGCASAAAVGLGPGFIIPSGPWNITDYPSYSWRGVLLDTGRNYIPIKSILRTLDGMSATKLNVLHWHIVDATSFPIVSETYPDLSKAAYSPLSIYSYADVQAIVYYATERGIRVIPEFDTPAHTNELAVSAELAPFVLCPNGGANKTNSYWPTCAEPPCGNINIADPAAASAISELINEYTQMFPDSVFHLGGDEIETFCLNTSPEFTDIAFGKGTPVPQIGTDIWTAGLAKVYQSYINTLLQTTSAAGKQTMHWEDIVLKDGVLLPNNTIIQVWNSWDNIASKNSLQKTLALDRYQIVDSNSDYYYLDGGSGEWLTDLGFGTGGNSWKENYWTPYKAWQRAYTHDPRTSPIDNTTDTTGTGYSTIDNVVQFPAGNLQSIIGGEVAVWTEKIGYPSLDVKLWPRAAAMGEALWSADAFPDAGAKDFFEALPRLKVLSDRLLSRGLSVETLQPAWCNTEQCSTEFSGYSGNLSFGNSKPTYW